jgi:hypothetical protein
MDKGTPGTPALDWLLRGGLCTHETRATCPVCSRTEAARAELEALLAERDDACSSRDAAWAHLADVARELGYGRASSPDFGEVDVVEVMALARSLAEARKLLAENGCACSLARAAREARDAG